MRLRCGIEFDKGDPVEKILKIFFSLSLLYHFLKVILLNTNYEDEVQEIKRNF